ncbi:MAG: ice-binding family protein [Patescibacteria group bacterium]
MKSLKKISLITLAVIALALGALGLNKLNIAQAATSPSLGSADGYAILASTYTNTSAGTTINGSVGFTTGPAVTPLGTHTNYGSGAPYAAAGSDQGTALASLAAQTCTFTFASGAINLSTDTTHGTIGVYTPGVYCSDGAMNVGGPLTLNGNGTYIFRSTGALNSTAGATITLNGASVCDVFWTPAAATTLAANTTFKGTVISDAGITIGANTNWAGRALSFGGTTTSDTDTITAPTCTFVPIPVPVPVPATLHVIKQVVNNNNGTAISADFILHVKNSNLDVAGSPAAGVSAPGIVYSLTSGTYNVSENANSSYIQSFSGDCDSSGNVTLSEGANKTCTIINTDIPPVIIPVVVATTTPTTTVTAIVAAPVIATATPILTAAPIITVPSLPNTGLVPNWISSPWNIIIPIAVLILILISLIVVLKKKKIN